MTSMVTVMCSLSVVQLDADGPLSRLKDKFFSKEAILGYFEWIKQHWWAVVLMGVGLILLMAGKGKVCIRAKWPIRPEFIPVSVA